MKTLLQKATGPAGLCLHRALPPMSPSLSPGSSCVQALVPLPLCPLPPLRPHRGPHLPLPPVLPPSLPQAENWGFQGLLCLLPPFQVAVPAASLLPPLAAAPQVCPRPRVLARALAPSRFAPLLLLNDSSVSLSECSAFFQTTDHLPAISLSY